MFFIHEMINRDMFTNLSNYYKNEKFNLINHSSLAIPQY